VVRRDGQAIGHAAGQRRQHPLATRHHAPDMRSM
jgi:hypothetical protein